MLAAQRELAEEVGLAADTWHVLVDLFTTPGDHRGESCTWRATSAPPTRPTVREGGRGGRDGPSWAPLGRVVEAVLAVTCQADPGERRAGDLGRAPEGRRLRRAAACRRALARAGRADNGVKARPAGRTTAGPQGVQKIDRTSTSVTIMIDSPRHPNAVPERAQRPVGGRSSRGGEGCPPAADTCDSLRFLAGLPDHRLRGSPSRSARWPPTWSPSVRRTVSNSGGDVLGAASIERALHGDRPSSSGRCYAPLIMAMGDSAPVVIGPGAGQGRRTDDRTKPATRDRQLGRPPDAPIAQQQAYASVFIVTLVDPAADRLLRGARRGLDGDSPP